MRLLLVNPPKFNGIGVIRDDRCENVERNVVHPPLSLVYLTGILRDRGHSAMLLDMNGNDLGMAHLRAELSAERPDMVIFRSTPSTFFHDCGVARLAKELGIETTMLNWNLSGFSAEALRLESSIDAYVTAYGYEHVISAMMDSSDYYCMPGITFRDGDSIVENPPPRKPIPVGDIAQPPWDCIEDHRVFYTRAKAISPWGVVRGSKGCGFSCNFCRDCGIPWDGRSPELVVEEVRQLVDWHRVKYITFFDNTFTLKRDWAYAVADGMIDRGIEVKWFMNTRPDVLEDDMVKRLKEAGLDAVNLGAEAGTDDMLDAINKGFTVADTRNSIQVLKDNGVKVFLALMMGMPGETADQMRATRDLVLETKPHGFQFNIVTPYPRTPLYEDCVRAGLIDHSLNWNTMSCVPTGLKETVSLAAIPSDELIALRQRFYWRLYLSPSYILPNIWWTVNHPADLKMAVSYAWGMLSNLYHKGAYTH